MAQQRTVGIIGGSGLYELNGLKEVTEIRQETAFGEPSDAIVAGTMGNTRFLFLPRHGRRHQLPPHRINARANILALKQAGAEQLISVSAVGSMKESLRPGDVVLPDQFIDRTHGRPNTFFDDDGVVAHVEFAEPVDSALQGCIYRAAVEAGARSHRGGTYICIEGPQFSTRAESQLFRSWGVDVIGMTNLPEARLAREAELPYATLALVTDYDCWHQEEASVSVNAVLETLKHNVETARRILAAVAHNLPDPAQSPASKALRYAILTKPEGITDAAKKRLGPLLRHLPKGNP